jgi:hypothetical protein
MKGVQIVANWGIARCAGLCTVSVVSEALGTIAIPWQSMAIGSTTSQKCQDRTRISSPKLVIFTQPYNHTTIQPHSNNNTATQQHSNTATQQ